MTSNQDKANTPSNVTWPEPNPVCWCLTNGRPSLENQTAGLARAMGLDPIMKRVALKMPWRALSPYFNPGMQYAVSRCGDSLAPPWPDIVLSAGRLSILPALLIKQQSRGWTFTTLLQDSFRHRNRFDKLVVPAHDRLQGPNILVTEGALHSVNPVAIAEARLKWFGFFSRFSRPCLAVLIGGSNSRYTLDTNTIKSLAMKLKRLASAGHGIVITPSRRTDREALEILQSALAETSAFIWDGAGDNPYLGMLAWADAVLVTADSVNMITEACSTGKPVYIIDLPYKKTLFQSRDKFSDFRANLAVQGRIRPFEGHIELWNATPLQEVERVAEILRRDYLTFRFGSMDASGQRDAYLSCI